jgi:hypothetical protein
VTYMGRDSTYDDVIATVSGTVHWTLFHAVPESLWHSSYSTASEQQTWIVAHSLRGLATDPVIAPDPDHPNLDKFLKVAGR